MADAIKDAVLKGGMQGGMGKAMPKPKSEPVEEIPSEIKDKLQDMKNKKAAENYQKTKDNKKGGMIKMAKGGSASSRADGCCVKGKTRGKMV
jgi:hypothetical protein